MHYLLLTYTRDAAPCPTLVGRTADAVRGVRDGAIFTPPHYLNFHSKRMLLRCRRKAASGVSVAAAEPCSSVAAVASAYMERQI